MKCFHEMVFETSRVRVNGGKSTLKFYITPTVSRVKQFINGEVQLLNIFLTQH